MGAHSLANARSVIDLNSPGHYLNWSIFQVSVANLVVIGVMVVIFGLALLIPFPDRHRGEPAADGAAGSPGAPQLRTTWRPSPGPTMRMPACGLPGSAAGPCGFCRPANCCRTGSPRT
jgi:hypothetical protein